jgi:hypothetical protein
VQSIDDVSIGVARYNVAMPILSRARPKLDYATTNVVRRPISLLAALCLFLVVGLLWLGLASSTRFIDISRANSGAGNSTSAGLGTEPDDAERHPERNLALAIFSFGGALVATIQAIRLQNRGAAI